MITPEEAAQEEAIIEIERRFEREYLRSVLGRHANVWIDLAKNAGDQELVGRLQVLADVCAEPPTEDD